MPPAARFLQTNSRNYPTAEPPGPLAADSDVVVVLAALLCALVCVAGLALVARCAWLRRTIASARAPPAAPANKGLKKKALQALPKLPYAPGAAGGSLSSECAICLAEFDEGDEVRVLPQCGHGFHVGCVDAWLGSNSSCPSCRRVLVVVPAPPAPARCHLCGANSDGPVAAAAEAAAGSKSRDDDDANKTLP